MFRTHHQRGWGSRPRRLGIAAGGLAVAAALLGSITGEAGAVAQASPPQPSITSVSFSWTSGPGVASPTITLAGSNFGTSEPSGTSDNITSCGPYTANGDVYGSQLYFADDTNFEPPTAAAAPPASA